MNYPFSCHKLLIFLQIFLFPSWEPHSRLFLLFPKSVTCPCLLEPSNQHSDIFCPIKKIKHMYKHIKSFLICISPFIAILLYIESLPQSIAFFWPISSSTQSGICPQSVTQTDLLRSPMTFMLLNPVDIYGYFMFLNLPM